MTKPKKKYPSQIKHDKNHPTVSARVPVEIRDKLKLVLRKQGTTLTKVLIAVANEQELKLKPIEEARKAGFEEARNLYMVTYPCSICGKPTSLTSPKAKEVASKFMTEHGWGHAKCHEQRRRS